MRALITIAGNPAVSGPDAARLDAALPGLACMVSVDNYLNETTRHAHVILPGLSPLEQPHYDELIWLFAVRNAAKFSPEVFAPPAGRPAEWEILLVLAALCSGAPLAEVDAARLDDFFFFGLVATLAAQPGARIAGRDPMAIVAATPGCGPERLLDFALRVGPHGEAYGATPNGLSLARLREHPHGLDFGALEPRLPGLLETPHGSVELAPPHITSDIARLRERLTRPDDGLLLVSRRHLRSNNSWCHNLPHLMTGRDRCTLLIHPEDAQRAGLRDGARARVTSSAGSLVVAAEVSDEMMRGVVSLPHGWGHDREGTRLSVAARHPGANNNLLAPGDMIDVPSNNAVVNGIPVRVEREEQRSVTGAPVRQ